MKKYSFSFNRMMSFLPAAILLFFFTSYCDTFGQDNYSNYENWDNQNTVDKIKWHIRSADSLIKVRKYKKGEILYEKAYEKTKKLKNDSLFVAVGNKYSDVLYNLTRMSKAIKINEMIIDLCKKNDNRPGLINAYLIKGRIKAYHEGKKFEAFQLFSKAIVLLDTKTPNKLVADCFYERGYLLMGMAQNQAARKDLLHAISHIKNKNSDQIAYLYEGISNTFSIKELDSISYYQNLVIGFCKKKDFSGNFCLEAYNDLAYTLLLKNEPKKAQALLVKYIDENDLDSKHNDAIYYQFLETKGGIDMALGKYDAAIEKLTIAKNYALERKELNSLLTILGTLSIAYEKNGDLNSSLATTRMIKPLMDSLDVHRIQREVAKLESERKLKKKEEEIITLQKEKESITVQMSKLQFTSYVFSFLLLIGILIHIYRSSTNRAKFHKLNEKVNHNRLHSLQSVMNPHFLFNTFGTLQQFILKREIRRANSYMTTLSDLIRNVFANSNSLYTHFNNEIAILEAYLKLELDRFNHNFEMTFDIYDKLTKDNPLIPSMILQPYVENAILQRFSEKKDNKKISIKFSRLNSNTVQCNIMDYNAEGKEVEEIPKKNLSIATKYTQERLKIINKKDELQGNIVIRDLYDANNTSQGTKVVILLPIIKNKDSKP